VTHLRLRDRPVRVLADERGPLALVRAAILISNKQ
jgi:hypothetical protein